MADQPQPLDREQLRRRFKEESARLKKERDDAVTDRVRKSAVSILSEVRKLCESPNSMSFRSLNKSPYLSFTLAEEEIALRVSQLLARYNCETILEKKHSYTCECPSSKDPCLVYVTAVDFWNDSSPERNAQ